MSDIFDWLMKFVHPIERVGLEAGIVNESLFFGLQAEGFDVVCVEARQVNAALTESPIADIRTIAAKSHFSPASFEFVQRAANGHRTFRRSIPELRGERVKELNLRFFFCAANVGFK